MPRQRHGAPRKFTGYCTDVFTGEAIARISRQRAADRPFFCYLPLNACHGPQRAP